MNSRAKGKRNEAKAYAILETQGYHCEKMNAPDRRNPEGHVDFFNLWDLIAVDPITGKTRYIQVKSNRLATVEDRKRMSAFCRGRKHSSLELWVFYDRVKEPRIIQL